MEFLRFQFDSDKTQLLLPQQKAKYIKRVEQSASLPVPVAEEDCSLSRATGFFDSSNLPGTPALQSFTTSQDQSCDLGMVLFGADSYVLGSQGGDAVVAVEAL